MLVCDGGGAVGTAAKALAPYFVNGMSSGLVRMLRVLFICGRALERVKLRQALLLDCASCGAALTYVEECIFQHSRFAAYNCHHNYVCLLLAQCSPLLLVRLFGIRIKVNI